MKKIKTTLILTSKINNTLKRLAKKDLMSKEMYIRGVIFDHVEKIRASEYAKA